MQVSLACDLQGLPPLVDDHRSRDPSEELVNILVPSYQFSCHGRVTNWAACVDPGGDRERYDIRFQVWRPSVDGCFTLVGVNVPSQLLAPVDHCVEYQVPRDDQIEVLPDDIIGFYVDRYKLSRREDELEDPANGGIQLDTEWSASVRLLSSGQLVGVGVRQCSLTQLDNNGAAPVLSASVGKRNCTYHVWKQECVMRDTIYYLLSRSCTSVLSSMQFMFGPWLVIDKNRCRLAHI